MIIEFDTKKLEKTFADEKSIKRTYGSRAAAVMRRMAELDAAENLEDMYALPAANCHELTGAEWRGCFALNISRNYRLIFRSTEQPPPMLDDGGINRMEVHSVTVIQIEDYH